MLIKIKAKPQVFCHVTINLLNVFPGNLGIPDGGALLPEESCLYLLFTHKSSC